MSEDQGGKDQKQKDPGIKTTEKVAPTPKDSTGKRPITLVDQVDDLQAKLKKEKEEILTKERELEAKKRASREIDKAAEVFGKTYEKLKTMAGDFEVHYKEKFALVTKKIDEKKKSEIKEIIKAVDLEIKNEEKKLKEAEKKVKDVEKTYDYAERRIKGIRENFRSAKRIQRDIEDKLRELDNAGKTFEGEEKKDNLAVMYYLIDAEEKEGGLGSLLKGLNRMTKKFKSFSTETGIKTGREEAVLEFKKNLEKEWSELYRAEQEIDLKEKKNDIQKAKEKLEENQKKLTKMQASRQYNILAKLREIKNFKEE